MSLVRLALQLGKISRPLPEWVPREEDGPQSNTTGYIPVQSTWVAGLKYTRDRGVEMAVKKGGKSYAYPGLNLASFRRWAQSKSPGKWWWRNIGHPMQNSRWVGPVHPLFGNGVDGPVVPANRFTNTNPDEAVAFLKHNISPHATPQHLAALIGWLPGTTATLNVRNASTMPYLSSYVRSPNGEYTASRNIGPNHGSAGEHILDNEYFGITDRSKFDHPFVGASGPVLLRQIRAAYELGIPRVKFHAAYTNDDPQFGPNFSGGLHWPTMGANGYLPPGYLNTVPPGIVQHANMASKGALLAAPDTHRTFEHFFKSPLAKAWYKDNPTPHEAFIDTTPGSYSRKAIERHVAENSTKYGQSPPIADDQLPKLPLHFGMAGAYHPMTEHLFATGSLHPDYFDQYFEN